MRTIRVSVHRGGLMKTQATYTSIVEVADTTLSITREGGRILLMFPKPTKKKVIERSTIEKTSYSNGIWMKFPAVFFILFSLVLEGGLGYVLSLIGLHSRNTNMVVGAMVFLLVLDLILCIFSIGRYYCIQCKNGKQIRIPAAPYWYMPVVSGIKDLRKILSQE